MSYKKLETIYKELKTIIDIEGDKHPQDSFLVTGHLDDLIEILDDLDLIANYDPTDYEMITNNSVGIEYHDGC